VFTPCVVLKLKLFIVTSIETSRAAVRAVDVYTSNEERPNNVPITRFKSHFRATHKYNPNSLGKRIREFLVKIVVFRLSLWDLPLFPDF
jgi:hypothetical protein